MLEKNGKTLNFFNGEVPTDRINAIQVLCDCSFTTVSFISCIRKHNIQTIYDDIQEAYWSIASALSEADGIDYTDPEEVQMEYSFSSSGGTFNLSKLYCLFIYLLFPSGAARVVNNNSYRS